MARLIDQTLASVLPEEKMEFYSVVRDFADAEIAPNSCNGSETTCSSQTTASRRWPSSAFSGCRSRISTEGKAATTPTWS